MAAFRHHMGASVADQIPDTGDLRGDVMAVLRRTRRSSEVMSPETLHGLLAELRSLPAVLMETLPAVMMTILRRAAARGEIDVAKVTPRIAALPGDLQRHQYLVTGRPVPDDFLSEVVDQVFLPLVLSPPPPRSQEASDG
jgi:hypothetical protein